MIRTPWGIVSVKRGVARKSCIFTKNVNFAYIKHIHFTQISLHFYKFEDKNISFLMYWTLLPSIKIRIAWDIVLIKQVLPENHAFLPKMAMLLRPYMHFREKSSVFYEFDDNYISFLHVLNVSLNYDQKTLGYQFSEWWCCQKIMPFYLKYNFSQACS